MTGADWLAWRAQGVGASDVAASWSGLYGGAYTVVAKKLGHVVDTIDPELADRGHRWEQPIADAVHALTGLYVVGEQAWAEHPDHPHRRATVDGFLADTPETTLDAVAGLLEIKTKTAGTRTKHEYHDAQVQAQMHVTGVQRALVAVASIGRDDQLEHLSVRWVEADPDQQTMLAAEYDRLWSYMQAGVLPDPDGPSAAATVRHVTRHADPDAETVDLEDLADQLAELDSIKQAVKQVTDRRDELEATIRHRLGSATKGRCDGWTVSYSRNANVLTDAAKDAILVVHPELGRTILDVDRAKDVLGDEYDSWKEPAGARRLTIRKKKQ